MVWPLKSVRPGPGLSAWKPTEIVVVTIYGATGEDKVGIMINLSFHCSANDRELYDE